MLAALGVMVAIWAVGDPETVSSRAVNDLANPSRNVSAPAPMAPAPSSASLLTPEYILSRQVVEEINRLRADPAGYARYLEAYREHFVGLDVYLPNDRPYRTREGVRAVDEAIADLRRRQPQTILRPEGMLDRSALDHVSDQGPRGGRGHFGSDGRGPTDRAARRGFRQPVGENISYGQREARAVVIQLLVDDGVPDRSHRHNLFSNRYESIGAGCGGHRAYGSMCVIDFGI